MLGGLDDNLVGANSVHHIIQSVGPALDLSFHTQYRILVGDDPDLPVWRIGGAGWPDGKDFMGRLVFVPVAERAAGHGGRRFRREEITRSPTPVGGDDDPMSLYRVPTKFRHGSSLFPFTILLHEPVFQFELRSHIGESQRRVGGPAADFFLFPCEGKIGK